MISRWIVAMVAAALAGSCSFAMADGLVTGTASFRERIAPPPDAAFEAVIEDVSRADAPAIVREARVSFLASEETEAVKRRHGMAPA